jgi:hypothetical protein
MESDKLVTAFNSVVLFFLFLFSYLDEGHRMKIRRANSLRPYLPTTTLVAALSSLDLLCKGCREKVA